MKHVSVKRVAPLVLAALTICGCPTQAVAAVCEGEFTRPAYKTRSYYCAPGQMVRDAYDHGREIPCEEMEVDHLISLRQAWDSGVCEEELKRLANDSRNLRFTHWRTNRAKGYLTPEEFAKRLPPQVSAAIMQDAEAVMRDYRVKSRDQTVAARMVAYATNGAAKTRIPMSALAGPIRKKIITRQIGGKVVAFIGKRAIGYALGVGVGIESIMAAGWATNWLTSPSQDERMKQRGTFFSAVLEGKK